MLLQAVCQPCYF